MVLWPAVNPDASGSAESHLSTRHVGRVGVSGLPAARAHSAPPAIHSATELLDPGRAAAAPVGAETRRVLLLKMLFTSSCHKQKVKPTQSFLRAVRNNTLRRRRRRLPAGQLRDHRPEVAAFRPPSSTSPVACWGRLPTTSRSCLSQLRPGSTARNQLYLYTCPPLNHRRLASVVPASDLPSDTSRPSSLTGSWERRREGVLGCESPVATPGARIIRG